MSAPVFSKRLPLPAGALLTLLLLVYIALRAVKVGFTHDESSSYMNLIHESLYDLFWNECNWLAANNHPLNTLCMQAGYHFFGAEEWALRWGSVLAGGIFFLYAWRTVRLWLPAPSWWLFGAFCLLILNHFVLDFFALARGYGWCVALETASMFYFFRWIQRDRRSDLFRSACALALGLLANFTLLDVLAAFFVTVSLAFYLKNERRFDWVQWLKMMALPALPIIASLLLILQPMRWIREKGEFEYGPQGFWETWRILVDRFVYNPFPEQNWWKVTALVIATIICLALGYKIIRRYRRAGLDGHSVLFYASILCVSTMLATVAQHFLLGANYLSGRTAILFYPLLSSVVVLYLIDLLQRRADAWKVGLAAIGFVVLNFCSHLNLRYALEWQYDENTREALLFAHQHSDPRHKLNYGVGWLVYSSTFFYQYTRALYNVDIVQYNASHDDLPWVRSQPFDLIYIGEKLQPQVEDQYSVLQRFPQGVLMQRKGGQ